MTSFSDRSNLPHCPALLAQGSEVAWHLIRELHGQARISTVECRVVLDALQAAPPAVLRTPEPEPDDDSAEAVTEAARLAGSAERLAELAGLSSRQVQGLLSGWWIAAAETAVKIEAATAGQVGRARLRLDLWPAGAPVPAGGDA